MKNDPRNTIFSPYLGGNKEYSAGWCMIYGPLGDSVCCSRVARPCLNREMTTHLMTYSFITEIKLLV